MILNASHDITLSGLPPDILDAYVRYKKGTRAIVMWIVQYGPSRYHGRRSLPLKELASLATAVSGLIKALPDVIHFHFRETIAARKRLSKYFRGHRDQSLDNLDTVNHEHFTTSLTQIYTDLCTCCGQLHENINNNSNNTLKTSSAMVQKLKNHYEHLPVEDLSINDAEVTDEPSCSECVSSERKTCSQDSSLIGFVDDDLSIAIEFTSLTKQADAIFEAVQLTWTKTARGDLHFVNAALVTNAAFAMMKRLEQQMRELDAIISFSGLHEKCCDMDAQEHNLLQNLQSTQAAISHYTNGHKLRTIPSCASCIQKPSDYIQKASVSSTSGDSPLLTPVVDNIMHLILSKDMPGAIVRNGTPLYADLGFLLTHTSDCSSTMQTTFGLYLLSQSYSQYLLHSQQPAMVSRYRLTGLRLAQEAARSIEIVINNKHCFPCRCPQTLAYHLQTLHTDLSTFAKHKCWDLYFQSPWVAGSHILEMLDMCHFYGSYLLNYRHYIGAVLHSYNVLQELAGLEQIPLLKQLCDIYKDHFFPGGQRPTSNFRASWSRYIGARLKFKKKGHKSRNHRESWCMAVPAHAAKSAAGLGLESINSNSNSKQGGGGSSTSSIAATAESTTTRTGCLLFKIKQQDYYISDAQRTELSSKIVPRPSTVDNDNQNNNNNNNHIISDNGDSQHPLLSLAASVQTYIDPCSHPPPSSTSSSSSSPHHSTPPHLPHARINHFTIFHDLLQIITRLSDATHTSDAEQGMNCICFVHTILGGGDRIAETRRFGNVLKEGAGGAWTKAERECVETAKKVIREVLEGVEEREWVYEI